MRRYILAHVSLILMVILASPVADLVSAAVGPAGAVACCPGENITRWGSAEAPTPEAPCCPDDDTARSCAAPDEAGVIRRDPGKQGVGCGTLADKRQAEKPCVEQAGCAGSRTCDADLPSPAQGVCYPDGQCGVTSDGCCGAHAELYSSAKGFCLVITLGRGWGSDNIRIDAGASKPTGPKGCGDADCR